MNQDQEKKIKDIQQNLLNIFQSNDVPKKISVVMFPQTDKPMNKLSLANKLIIFSQDTQDARTFLQWSDIKRSIKKGAKAFYLLKPCIKVIKEENKETKETEEKKYLSGFIPYPVFSLESTEGKEIIYPQLSLPETPLLQKAKDWNINIKLVQENSIFLGKFNQDKKEITLATPSQKTFFHELAHAAHGRIETLKNGQDSRQEICAEMVAQILCQYYRLASNTEGNTYEYLQRYSQNPGQDCLKFISTIDKILKEILS